jgi:hypothetical protein
MSESICICKEIKCPYFCELANGFGCRRYNVSGHCHLIEETNLRNNQYALYTSDRSCIEYLKQKNNTFFSLDEKYRDDLKFQQENADWFTEKDFKLGVIHDSN